MQTNYYINNGMRYDLIGHTNANLIDVLE